MSGPTRRELTIRLARAEPEEKVRIIRAMSWQDVLHHDADFECWSHESQLEPTTGGWRTWLMMAGRGFGKTRAGAEWIEKLARSRPQVRIALVGASIDEARRIMVEGVSGVLGVAERNKSRVKWEPSIGRLTWSNGSQAQLFSGENPDGLRGPEHDFAWVLTFEIVADAAPVAAGAILADVSGGAIAASASAILAGYAAHGAAIGAAIEPLVEVLAIPLLDDGTKLVSPPATLVVAGEDELGCSAGAERADRRRRSQVPASDLPSGLSLTYYDASRDHQAGLARAATDDRSGANATIELPAVIEAGSAKALAESALARRWAERDRLALRLPPGYAGLVPGSLVQAGADQQKWVAEKVTLDSFVVVAELRPAYSSSPPLPADPGRSLPSLGVVPAPTIVTVAEMPGDGEGATDLPVVVVAASASSGRWRPVPLEVQVGSDTVTLGASAGAAIQGVADTLLGSGQAALVDQSNAVEVVLANDDDWIESVDDDALVNGANLALIGRELVQFGEAVVIAPKRFRLSRLLRGRRGTEWAMTLHQPGEPFVMVDAARLKRVAVRAASAGGTVRVTPKGLGDGSSSPIELAITGEAMRPPAPVHLRAAIAADGGLDCSWVRRSSRGWAWLDSVDVPLAAATEVYRVSLSRNGSQRLVETGAPYLALSAAALAQLGSGNLNISVVQVGDYALSRPAELILTIDQG